MRIDRKTNKMKSQESKGLWSTQTEKPIHYTYLKEFRVEQCTLFLQHKCTQHRPYTCFHWHFLNQRRRRPIRRRDGTFNYSPDAYCNKFDENTGICPDGDDCPYLHRTAGDTERRYHLRYYKTGMCVHDTDSRGMCVKNGPHCAFAHGVDDVRHFIPGRPPVYDIRELQALDMIEQDAINGTGPNNLDKERNTVNDDPKWQDTSYVLANYKTEQCKRPPRLCRQGYACPQYHNSRDRRRSPKKFKYRSTACPNVKHGDEWGEPSNCEGGDSCQYCHTRTEQQFHPEIYKSTKCNDIQQNGYCPRGAFCAFAHLEQEMSQVRESVAETLGGTSLADILQSALPADTNHHHPPNTQPSSTSSGTNSFNSENSKTNNSSVALSNSSSSSISKAPGAHLNKQNSSATTTVSSSLNDSVFSNGLSYPPPPTLAPIGSKPRHLSGNSLGLSGSCEPLLGLGGLVNSSYQKAPGSEREDRELSFKKQLASIDSDPNLDPLEKAKRKQSLFLANLVPSHPPPPVVSMPPSCNSITPSSSFVSSMTGSLSSTVSPLALPFYPTSDTVESVVGLLGSSAPVTIPGCGGFHDGVSSSTSGIPLTNPSPSSTSSPSAAAFNHSFLTSPLLRENSLDQGVSGFLSSNGCSKMNFSSSGGLFDLSNMSPHSRNPLGSGLSHSPLIGSGGPFSNCSSEIQRLRKADLAGFYSREELSTNRAKLASWEEGIAQARTACEAWRREADDASRKCKIAEQTKEEYFGKLASQQKELEELRAGRLGPYVQTLHPHIELEKLPLHTLKALQSQLKQDLDSLEKVIHNYGSNDQWPGVVTSW